MPYEDKTPRGPRGKMSKHVSSLLDSGLIARMRDNIQQKRAREKQRFVIYRMVGVMLALSTVLLAFRADITLPDARVDWQAEEQEVIDMNQITVFEEPKPVERPEPTRERPPEPRQQPAPQAPPVEVPDEVQIDASEELAQLDAELDREADLEIAAPAPAPAPPPPPEEPAVFVVAEQMPELVGGISALQQAVEYPEMAYRAGVEGRVIVQFVVDEQGRVTEPRVLKGIGAGADEEALRVIRQARFTPGKQNGKPVKVRMSIPITFKLQ